MIVVIEEFVVISYVRRRAALMGAGAAADQAVAHALTCLAGGASANEACAEGERFLGSWKRHPSRPVRTKQAHLRIAS